MRTSIRLFFLIVFTICTCCENNSSETGKVVFYTDIHARINCGRIDVIIFIDNDSIGILSEPYLFAAVPECATTTKTLMVEKQPGKYSYSAIVNCGDLDELKGEFEIIANQCTNIYFTLP